MTAFPTNTIFRFFLFYSWPFSLTAAAWPTALCSVPFVPAFQGFERAAFLSDFGYIYLPNDSDAFKWVYLAAGIGLPLLLQRLNPTKQKIYPPQP